MSIYRMLRAKLDTAKVNVLNARATGNDRAIRSASANYDKAYASYMAFVNLSLTSR